ncbi:hemogen-like isoform X4 [Narcine bancroftii]|uniref:hemogen-like isoform X4 n=1 Tax=Narcine bancroftii TaxID=1343680 RepID=UPI003831FC81
MDTMESTQSTKDQKIPGVLPYRLRDREQLRKRKMEALEQKNSQWVFKEKTKTKRRKGKACGKSSKPTKEPEPKPDPKYNPQPEPCQEQKEEAKDKMPQLSPECEIPAPLQKIPSLSITEDLATSTDELEKIKLASLKIPEILPLQAKDMPGEEASSEEQIVLSM